MTCTVHQIEGKKKEDEMGVIRRTHAKFSVSKPQGKSPHRRAGRRGSRLRATV